MAIFLVQIFLRIIPGAEVLTEKFMLTPYMPSLMMQPWSLFTYIFMHANLMHVLGNMLWLYFIGILLEDLLGNKHIWKLFFASFAVQL